MSTDTTLEDPRESSAGTPSLEVFGSPLERKIALDGVLGALFEGEGDAARAELTARVGRYSILRKLGAGGMGVVLLGYDEQLHREAAIKLIRAKRDSPEAQQRMLREAQGLARLSHPNVVQVYEGGLHEGSAYIAMELVTGQTLSQWLGQERERGQILAVFEAAGRGLAAAHAAGLVHRDFKPGNVMISDDGRVKVMDFGLARGTATPGELEATAGGAREGAREALPTPAPSSGDSGGDSKQRSSGSGLMQPLTRTGALLGTPAYMSPEQFATGQFDARSDQFAFCVALWEALVGARPFRGRNIVELSAAVNAGRVELPPGGEGRIPLWLERILRRGLAVDPDARWPSMDALLEALGHDPAPRRQRWTLAAVGALALAGATAVLAPYLVSPPAPPLLCSDAHALLEPWQPGPRAALAANLEAHAEGGEELSAKLVGALEDYADAWAAAHQDACAATHLRHEQSAALLDARMRCLDERSRELGALVGVLSTSEAIDAGKAIQEVAGLVPVEVCSNREYLESQASLPADPQLAAQVQELRGRGVRAELAAKLGDPEVIGELEALIEEADALDYAPLRAELLVNLGAVQGNVSAPEEARDTLEEAMILALRTGQDRLASEAALELCFVIGFRMRDPAGSARLAAFVRAWNERFDAPRITRLRMTMTEVLTQTRSNEPGTRTRIEAGVAEILDTLEVRQEPGGLVGLEGLGLAEAYLASGALNVRAVMAYDDGDMQAARDTMLEVAKLRRRILTPEHPQVQLMELNLAAVALYLGEWGEVQSRLSSIEAGVHARRHSRPNDLAILRVNHGELVFGRLTVLGASERAAAEAAEAAMAQDLPELAEAPGVDVHELHLGRSSLLRALGRLDESEASLAAAEAVLVDSPELETRRARVEVERGALAHARGQPLVALAAFERASQRLAERPYGSEKVQGPLAYERAKVSISLAREAEAIADLNRAIAAWDEDVPQGHPWTAPCHDLLAQLEVPEAAAHRERAAQIRARLR